MHSLYEFMGINATDLSHALRLIGIPEGETNWIPAPGKSSRIAIVRRASILDIESAEQVADFFWLHCFDGPRDNGGWL